MFMCKIKNKAMLSRAPDLSKRGSRVHEPAQPHRFLLNNIVRKFLILVLHNINSN